VCEKEKKLVTQGGGNIY